jgi:hypothetical protein
VLGVVTADRVNLLRCLLLAAGAAAVIALSWLLGHLVQPQDGDGQVTSWP